MIKKLSLDHKGGFYLYRAHQPKVDRLCVNGFDKLKKYIEEMFWSCPNEHFQGEHRSSKLKFSLGNFQLKQLNGHEMSMLASLGLQNNKDVFKTNHSKVQVFMLEHDDNTVAIEVPVWLHKNEFNFNKFIENEKPLTGHIDVLRVEGNYIWIWDYKPRAIEEKFASTQIYFYCLMLSNRTGIPLEKFRCGYFDDRTAFVFDPNFVNLDVRKLDEF
ncbi:PD-(D/E)XK nuclease family protein [Candidatus Woesearchaeota archaeon]|nr:PD-(D/E)XK nuclease family protein [Candidatus Woesearchaeota archaeon]